MTSMISQMTKMISQLLQKDFSLFFPAVIGSFDTGSDFQQKGNLSIMPKSKAMQNKLKILLCTKKSFFFGFLDNANEDNVNDKDNTDDNNIYQDKPVLLQSKPTR